MLKQKADRNPSVNSELWAMYEQAWAEFTRTPTDGAGNAALSKARAKVDAIEEAMLTGRIPERVTVQDVFDYHLQLDVRLRATTSPADTAPPASAS